MGRVSARDLRPEFQRALEGLEPGEVSPVVEVDGHFVLLQFLTDAGERWREARSEGREALAEGELELAVEAFTEALRVADTFSATDYRRARALNNLGAARYAGGNYSRAAELFDEAVGILRTAVGEDHVDVADGLTNLADARQLEGRYRDAESALRDALRIRERVEGPDSEGVARTASRLARTLELEGRPAEAEALYGRSLSIWDAGDSERAHSLMARGAARESLGRHEDAEADYALAHAALESSLGPADRATIDALTRRGNVIHQMGRYAEASAISERILALRWGTPDGDSPLPLLEAGTALLAASSFRDDTFGQLFQEVERAISISDLPGDVYLFVSDVFSEADAGAEAVRVLEAILPKFPGSRLIEYEIGEALARSGNNAGAIERFMAAVEMPSPPGLGFEDGSRELSMFHRRLGDMHVSNSNFESAAAAYDAAIALDPDNAEARIGRAGIYLVSNETEAAVAQYNRVLSDDADNVRAVVGLAEAQIQLQRFDEAIDAAQAALALDADNPTALFHRGTARLRSGNAEAAQEDLKRYRQLEAESRESEERSRVARAASDEADEAWQSATPEAAVDVLATAINENPDASPLYLDLAHILLRLDRPDEAVDVLESVIAQGLDDDFVVHHVLARAHDRTGNTERAEEYRSRYLAGLVSQLTARFQ